MRTLSLNAVASLLLASCVLVIGCAEGPLILELAHWNPYVRRQWDEDERFGPTFYSRLDEFRAVRAGAAKLTPAEQDHLCGQLGEVLAHDENPLLRREAVRTLGELATPHAEPLLREAVSDPNLDVRIAACEAWGKRGGQEAAAILAGVVAQDGDIDLRIAAAEQLGRFAGDQVAIRRPRNGARQSRSSASISGNPIAQGCDLTRLRQPRRRLEGVS